jgi:hypothetical protein
MSSHEPSRTPAGIPLQALVAELRGRCEAISRLQGGDPYYGEELAIFLEVARGQNLFLQAPPNELSRVFSTDTHRGNIILMDDGLLAPIDLRVQALSGSLLDTVTQLCVP